MPECYPVSWWPKNRSKNSFWMILTATLIVSYISESCAHLAKCSKGTYFWPAATLGPTTFRVSSILSFKPSYMTTWKQRVCNTADMCRECVHPKPDGERVTGNVSTLNLTGNVWQGMCPPLTWQGTCDRECVHPKLDREHVTGNVSTLNLTGNMWQGTCPP